MQIWIYLMNEGEGKVHDTIVLVGSKYYYDVVDNYLLFCSLYVHVSLSQVVLMSNKQSGK